MKRTSANRRARWLLGSVVMSALACALAFGIGANRGAADTLRMMGSSAEYLLRAALPHGASHRTGETRGGSVSSLRG